MLNVWEWGRQRIDAPFSDKRNITRQRKDHGVEVGRNGSVKWHQAKPTVDERMEIKGKEVWAWCVWVSVCPDLCAWLAAWSFLTTSSLKSKWTLPLAQGERRYISPTQTCTHAHATRHTPLHVLPQTNYTHTQTHTHTRQLKHTLSVSLKSAVSHTLTPNSQTCEWHPHPSHTQVCTISDTPLSCSSLTLTLFHARTHTHTHTHTHSSLLKWEANTPSHTHSPHINNTSLNQASVVHLHDQ